MSGTSLEEAFGLMSQRLGYRYLQVHVRISACIVGRVDLPEQVGLTQTEASTVQKVQIAGGTLFA